MCVSGFGVPIFTSWALSRVDMDVGIAITSAEIAVVVVVSMVEK
jgi:hypothetical protein